MELTGTHTFAASPEAVWNALHNSEVLKNTIPGVESVAWQGESAVTATISGIGPIKGPYSGTVQVAEHTAPSHLKIVRNGNSISGALTVDLAPNGSGTLLTYGATGNLGGPFALLDNPLTRPVIDSQINQFFTRLESQIK
jgi:uncharacterized protein